MNLPNKITLTRIILIPVFALFFLLEVIPFHYFWACLVFIVAACTDFLDGYIARSRNLVTNLGKFLDPIADKVLVSTALILLLIRPEALSVMWTGSWVMVYAGICVAVILARELIVSGFRMVAASRGLVLAADRIGKAKTTFQDLAIVFLLLGAGFFGLSTAERIFNLVGIVCLGVATVLTIWSGASYIVRNRQVLKEPEEEKETDGAPESAGETKAE